MIARGATLYAPRGVLTIVPAGNPPVGRVRAVDTTVHLLVADGQYTQPLLLQMSISPLSFTDHAHRAPAAVLSMHMPTAVLPSVAKAGVDSMKTATATIAAHAMPTRREVVRVVRKNMPTPSKLDWPNCFVIRRQDLISGWITQPATTWPWRVE